MQLSSISIVQFAGAKPAWLLIGRWVFLSTVPSGLLVAITAHISTELTSAPLLWVMPLSLYLLTWVLVFQRKPALSHVLVLSLQPFAVAGIVALLYLGHRVPMVPSLIGHLLAFFIIAMGCHGELARTRPVPAYLSSFYVSLSFGGMLGGLFAGLLAPSHFLLDREGTPILAALAVLCRPWTPRQQTTSGSGLQRSAPALWSYSRFCRSTAQGQRCASSTWRCFPSPRCQSCSCATRASRR